jgi:hypothetical protein
VPLDFDNIAIAILRFAFFVVGFGALFLHATSVVYVFAMILLFAFLGLAKNLRKTRLICQSCAAPVEDQKLKWTRCRPSVGPLKSIPCLRRFNVPVEEGAVTRLLPNALLKRMTIRYHQLMAGAFEDQNEARVVRHLKQLEVLGGERGLIDLGVRYLEGKGVKEDHEKAYRCFDKAAQKNGKQLMYAEFNLGSMHMNGQFVPANSAKAGEFFAKAAQKGFPPAQYNLGLALIDGWMGYEDYEAGVEWMEKAAASGIDEAREVLERLQKFNQ